MSTTSTIDHCIPSSRTDTGVAILPTRQANALRLLLDKPDISPKEVAAIDYKVLERAPGIGQKGLDVIRAWLSVHGYSVTGQPSTPPRPREEFRKRKLERAIDYLRGLGYEVRRTG